MSWRWLPRNSRMQDKPCQCVKTGLSGSIMMCDLRETGCLGQLILILSIVSINFTAYDFGIRCNTEYKTTGKFRAVSDAARTCSLQLLQIRGPFGILI